jgi:hypothetical protein
MALFGWWLGPAEAGLIGLLLFAFWLWMLVDCIQRGPSGGNEKIIWVLVIVLLGPIGAAVYFLVQRSKWR